MSQPQSDLERAMLVMDKLARQNARLKRARSEPIAIIGMGLRFPGGARDPSSFWRFLEAGGDGIVAIAERWRLAGIEPPGYIPLQPLFHRSRQEHQALAARAKSSREQQIAHGRVHLCAACGSNQGRLQGWQRIGPEGQQQRARLQALAVGLVQQCVQTPLN